MTISKKLLTIGVLVLGMNYCAQAYNTIALKTEITQILDFAEKYPTTGIAHWLQETITQRDFSTTDYGILTIARIINSDLTDNAKISKLCSLKIQWTIEHIKEIQNNIKHLEALQIRLYAYCKKVAY